MQITQHMAHDNIQKSLLWLWHLWLYRLLEVDRLVLSSTKEILSRLIAIWICQFIDRSFNRSKLQCSFGPIPHTPPRITVAALWWQFHVLPVMTPTLYSWDSYREISFFSLQRPFQMVWGSCESVHDGVWESVNDRVCARAPCVCVQYVCFSNRCE